MKTFQCRIIFINEWYSIDAEDQGSITHTDHDSASTACDVTNIPSQTGTSHLDPLFGGEYKTNNVTADIQTLPPEPRSSRIPNMKDFLVAFSTIPGKIWKCFINTVK